MSLSVYICSKQAGFDTAELDKQIPEPYNDLFGFESTRKTIWGHPIILTLGCKMINCLKDYGIFVCDEDVFELKGELNTIRENLELVSAETGYEKEYIDFRLGNALEVIKIVEKNLDVVGIAIG